MLLQQSPHQYQQDHGMNNTNLGQTKQHKLREAQQQEHARPGQYEQTVDSLMKHNKPQSSGKIGQTTYDAFDFYSQAMADFVPDVHPSDKTSSDNFSLYSKDSAFDSVFDSAFDDFSGENEKMMEYEIEAEFNAMMNRAMAPLSSTSAPSAGNMLESNALQRPYTPPNKTDNSIFPMTPEMTPSRLSRKVESSAHHHHAGQYSPVNRHPEDTIKTPQATPMKRGSSYQESSRTRVTATMSPDRPVAPHTAPLKSSATFERSAILQPSFMDMSTFKRHFPADADGYDSSHYSPTSHRISPDMSSYHSSPDLPHLSIFPEISSTPLSCPIEDQYPFMSASNRAATAEIQSSPAKASRTPRSQSTDAGRAAEFGGVIALTAITEDEISSFIQDPMPIDDGGDGKWMCLYDKCSKRFGRKENIRAHIQTHLGDRQFVCIKCKKRFVRQHDLKRHAKTHSKEKPFVCSCGHQFARHDALTRHRSRGVCIGAFAGTLKREVKRGRPKKAHRPDSAERQEKAARTRQRVLEKMSGSSSVSGSSEYSLPSPPELFFDDVPMRESSPLENFPRLEPDVFGISQGFSFTDTHTQPLSPVHSTGDCFSPALTSLERNPSLLLSKSNDVFQANFQDDFFTTSSPEDLDFDWDTN